MPPHHLGPYTITGTLGRGGMGTVYEATDDLTGAQVAVKTLAMHLGDDPALRRRFLAEIEVLKSLRHPGIVRLLAFGDEDGQPYFAMELVRGHSLEHLLRAGRRFDWRETVTIALAVARALKSAHDNGVIHRDLKPANLLVPDGPTDDGPVKLADFGIARLFGGSSHTVLGSVVGTAEYMAPEQASGDAFDHRVDLYALGLVIYAMIAGRPPFHGGEASDVLRRQRTEKPPRLSAVVADVPPELDHLVERLLAKDPAARPGTALAVGRLLSSMEFQPASSPLDPAALPPPMRPNGVDLLAVTRSDRDAAPGGRVADGARLPVDGDADTKLMTSPAAPDDAATAGSGAGGSGSPDAAGRHATRRFVTLEDLHREAREAERSQRRKDLPLQLAAGIGIAVVLAGGGYALLRRPSADELHARIMTIAENPRADLRDAEPMIKAFLAAHEADPRAAAVRDLQHDIHLDLLEKRSRWRRPSSKRLPAVEQQYREAMQRKARGPQACIEALEAVLALYPETVATDTEAELATEERTSLWLDLMRRSIAELREEIDRDVATVDAILGTAADLTEEAAHAEDDGERAELDRRRRSLLTGLVDLHRDKPHVSEQVERARTLLSAPPAVAEDAKAP